MFGLKKDLSREPEIVEIEGKKVKREFFVKETCLTTQKEALEAQLASIAEQID